MGDPVTVHYGNMDMRTQIVLKEVCNNQPSISNICFKVTIPEPIKIHKRIHSLYPQGFVFKASADGTYPLSPPDSTRPVYGILLDESLALPKVPRFSGTLKKDDHVPTDGTFIYNCNIHFNTTGTIQVNP